MAAVAVAVAVAVAGAGAAGSATSGGRLADTVTVETAPEVVTLRSCGAERREPSQYLHRAEQTSSQSDNCCRHETYHTAFLERLYHRT